MAKGNSATVEETTAVAAQEKAPVALAPAFLVETSAQDMVLPFLKVIQSQADEVTRGKEKYNENVKAGDIYDSTTRSIYNDAEIIVCGIRKYYGEWEGDVRGKLLAKHRVDSLAVKNAKKIPQVSPKGTPYFDLESEAGNRLEETFGVVCVVKKDGVTIPATFTLSKSAFSVGKTLNTMLTMYQMQGVPKFKFGTNLKQNEKGSWFVPVFDFVGYETEEDVIAMAKGIHENIDGIIFSFAAGEVDVTADNADIV